MLRATSVITTRLEEWMAYVEYNRLENNPDVQPADLLGCLWISSGPKLAAACGVVGLERPP